MAARLTDKQKKKIIADYIELGSYNAAAKINNVSRNTVKNIVNENAAFAQKCQEKKEESTKEILAHMDEQKEQVCTIIDKILKQMSDDVKIASTPLNQLATTMGILIDKFTASELTKGPSKEGNNLADAIANSVKELGDKNEI